MATVETPRSARRRQITADVKQIGVDLAGGVLDSLAARAPGPIGQLRALLEKLDLFTVDSILSLAEGAAHPDNGELEKAAPPAVAADLVRLVADLDDADPDKAGLVAF